MPISIANKTTNPLINKGSPQDIFSGLSVTDSAPLDATETVTVTLSPYYFWWLSHDTLGSLSDPSGGGSFVNNTFTESGLVGGSPDFASNLLSRLVYTPPALSPGQSFDFQAAVSVTNTFNDTATTSAPVIVDVVTAPGIAHTTPNQPVLGGTVIRPFATTQITDVNFDYTASDDAVITITDNGQVTDLYGLFTGPGLSKTSTGTFAVAGYQPYNLASVLNGLEFATTPLAADETKTLGFTLVVTDPKAGLTAKNTDTSITIVGPPTPPVPPTILGTQASQKVETGNVISPFHSVTIGDANTGASDTITITVTDTAGKATDTVGTFGAQTWLSHTPGSGVYTIAAGAPNLLTTEIDSLVFTPAQHANLALAVTNVGGKGIGQTAGDHTTTVDEVAATKPTPPAPPDKPPTTNPGGTTGNGNFLVHNQTSGMAYQAAGDAYTGPVSGIERQIIFVTSDNLNVNAEVPNVFIHGGSGQDGLTASSGTNILDGSTNSNFLIGATGTSHDTFYLDDRNPATPIFSTIVNFHPGDDVTVFGVTKSDFAQIILEGQGAQGYTGVDLIYSAPGHVDTSFVLAGYTAADLTNGKLTQSWGRTQDLPGAPGADYMTLHGN